MNLPPVTPALPGARQARPRVVQRLWRIWDRLAIYLPLVLMGVLALLTYWMVRVTPPLSEPQELRPKVHEVDFFMRDAVVRTYDEAGQLQQQLAGVEMRHYADDATVEVDRPVWWSRAPDGRITHGRALRSQGKDDGSEVRLIGQAVVVRDPQPQGRGPALARLEFRGEFLHIFSKDERLQSHLPVQIFNGQHQFSGNTLDYDHGQRTAQLQGRVTVRLVPEPPARPQKGAR